MTTPDVSAMSSISSDIAAVQSRIAAIAGLVTQTRTDSTSSTSGSDFAQTLADTTSTDATASGSTVAGASGLSGDSVVADAKQYLGVPYVWGGESNSGLDCSGLVQKTYSDLGVKLPRTAAEQQKVGTAVPSLADAQPGDLLFFGQPAYHVAIYAGNNQLVESPEPGKTVHVTDVYQQPTSIRRIVGSDVAGATATTGTVAGGTSADALTAAGINGRVAAYAPQFAAAEQKYGLPSGMLAAVAQQESGGNPNAVSGAGAEGLMQLMPATAKGAGVNAFDPGQAIGAAAHILSRNMDEFGGSVSLALAAYNAGAGAVKQYGGVPPYSETQGYVKNITAMMAAGG
jgi:peptidoglycan DL-endopeptidase CwlO